MKRLRLQSILILILTFAFSCNLPETTVTNIVHRDGSVIRKLEIRNSSNNFNVSDIQVPLDSTWIIRDSMEVSVKGDTSWVRRAEKLYKNADGITKDYQADSGANRQISRHAEFRKRFRWFNTRYRFSEIIDKKMNRGFPITDFLSGDELEWFYSPDNFTSQKKTGPDSLKYKALSDTVQKKTEKWMFKCLVSEIISEFERLTSGKEDSGFLADSLKAHENELIRLLIGDDQKIDSLWSNGILLQRFSGREDAVKFLADADSAVSLALDNIFIDFREYTVRTIMPGKLTATNGFIDSSDMVLWPVKSEYFLTQKYEMYAESQVRNIWACILTGVFILFVLAGVILKRKS
ncbi:MAG: hypothetical protein GYA41_09840 [Bacteroidales bacterium]|nr:hypothetical protein [Bacteroidales bacterium]